MLIDRQEILYIYFIYIKRKLVYIGRTKHPLKRINEHRLGGCISNTDQYKVIIYGPYEKWHAYTIESYEIIKRSRSKYLQSKTNSNYGYSEKISVKDSGQKTIYLFTEGGQVKKMVS